MTQTGNLDAAIRVQRRAVLSRHPVMLGIDFVEARRVDASRWDLLVSFVSAEPATGKQSVPIDIQSSNVRVTRVHDGSDTSLTVKSVSPPENGSNLLKVSVASSPDMGEESEAFSQYQLDIVDVENIDRYFSGASFSLHYGASGAIDPQAPVHVESGEYSDTNINYLAKDYESFRTMMLDRLANSVPGWTERNPSDLGIMLVDLMAYAGDYLSYYQDSVGTEAYLNTARRRVSVARLVRLLGYRVHQGCNSRVWVHVGVNKDKKVQADVERDKKVHVGVEYGKRVHLKAGSPLMTRLSGYMPCIPESFFAEAVAAGQAIFETMHAIDLYYAHNCMPFYAWQAEELTIPKGATRATLRGRFSKLTKGDVLVFEIPGAPSVGDEGDTDDRFAQAVRLLEVSFSSDPIANNEDVTEIAWALEDALKIDLPVAVRTGTGKTAAIARGNIVLADFGSTLEGEQLPVVPGDQPYRPRLSALNLTYSEPYNHARAARMSAASTLQQRPNSASPAITLQALARDQAAAVHHLSVAENLGEVWTTCDDLLESSPFARDFKVETGDDLSSHLLFGDDILGQRPVHGTRFEARYRIGNGPQGNVAAGAISHIFTSDDRICEVRNPLPAEGGAAPELTEDVRLFAPQNLRIQERCVTPEDYAERATNYPDVEGAVAAIRWTGSWQTMFLYISRTEGRLVDESFKRDLREYMQTYRMMGYDLEVEGPRYVSLDIALTIHLSSEANINLVREQLYETFGTSNLPDNRRGFFHPGNFRFGQSVYLSQIVTSASRVSGVIGVVPQRFKRLSIGSDQGVVVDELQMGHNEIARLENDLSEKWKGVIRFAIEGGR